MGRLSTVLHDDAVRYMFGQMDECPALMEVALKEFEDALTNGALAAYMQFSHGLTNQEALAVMVESRSKTLVP